MIEVGKPTIYCNNCEHMWYPAVFKVKKCPKCGVEDQLEFAGYGKISKDRKTKRLKFRANPKLQTKEPKIYEMAELLGINPKIVIDFVYSISKFESFLGIISDLNSVKAKYRLERARIRKQEMDVYRAAKFKAESEAKIELARWKNDFIKKNI